MKPGLLKPRDWLLGALASCGLMIGACMFAIDEGLSVRTGDVEINVLVSAEQGILLRFAHVDS